MYKTLATLQGLREHERPNNAPQPPWYDFFPFSVLSCKHKMAKEHHVVALQLMHGACMTRICLDFLSACRLSGSNCPLSAQSTFSRVLPCSLLYNEHVDTGLKQWVTPSIYALANAGNWWPTVAFVARVDPAVLRDS